MDYSVDEKKKFLADYLGIDVENVEEGYSENIFEIKDSNEEYFVGNYEESYDAAKEDVINIYEDLGLESFTEDFQDWIIMNAINEDYLDDYISDIADSQVESMDDDDLIQFAIDNGMYTEEDIYEEDEDGELVIREDFEIEKLRDEVREFIAPSDEADYSEKIDYIEDYYGLDTFKDEMRDMSKGNPDVIDIDVVADECIEEDGIAHFVASYDGEEIELDDDLYAYRMN